MADKMRAWATIPEVADALSMDRQTLRNRATRGEIKGAVREDGGQHRWQIPGMWLCKEVQKKRGLPEIPRGVIIPRPRRVRGSDPARYVTTSLMIWMTPAIAEAEAFIEADGVPAHEVIK